MPDNLKLYTFAKVKSLSMQVLKEDIRGRILTVARQQFGQKGYSKTSMREIQATHIQTIQTISRVRTAGREEIFTEVSSFFYEQI